MKPLFMPWLALSLALIAALPARAELTAADNKAIAAQVERWNSHLNGKASAGDLYADQVSWFGENLSRDAVLHKQQEFAARAPHFSQRIISTLDINETSVGDVEVDFVKQAGVEADNVKNYPAQLTFLHQSAGWRISGETDLLTRLNQKEAAVQGALTKGKFDGVTKETVWVSARDPHTGGSCTEEGDCDCALWSSNPAIKPVTLPQCIGATVETLSGLDDSGQDRVVIFPQWWTSAWSVVYVYDIQQGEWVKSVPSFPYNSNVQEDDDAAALVKRDPQHPGFVLVKKALWDEKQEEIVTPQESEALQVVK